MSKKTYTLINKEESLELIEKYKGKIWVPGSFGPQKVYELENGAAIAIFSFEKRDYYYANKNDVIFDPIKDSRWFKCKPLFEQFDLNRKLALQVIVTDLKLESAEKLHLTDIKILDKYLNTKILKLGSHESFFKTIIFIGEIIVLKNDLEWRFELKQKVYEFDYLEPFLVSRVTNEKFDSLFLKYISEWFTKEVKRLYLQNIVGT